MWKSLKNIFGLSSKEDPKKNEALIIENDKTIVPNKAQEILPNKAQEIVENKAQEIIEEASVAIDEQKINVISESIIIENEKSNSFVESKVIDADKIVIDNVVPTIEAEFESIVESEQTILDNEIIVNHAIEVDTLTESALAQQSNASIIEPTISSENENASSKNESVTEAEIENENPTDPTNHLNVNTPLDCTPSGTDYFVKLNTIMPVILKDGDVIASKPYFGEERFVEKLILIIDVSETNIVGICINNNADITTNIMIDGKPIIASIGGPVQSDLMVCTIYSPENGVEAMLTGEEKIASFIAEHQPNASSIKIVFGLIGWGIDQFNDEYNTTVWHICKNFKYEVADWNNANLWQKIMDDHYKNAYKKVIPKLKVMYKGDVATTLTAVNKNGEVENFEMPQNMKPLFYPIADDLGIGLVEDIGNSYVFVNNDFLDKNKTLSIERLINQSIRTFTKDVAELIDIQETGNGFFVVKADGNLESSIVLIDEFMNYLHQTIGVKLMIGLPATNLLLIADAESISKVMELKKAMIQFFETENLAGALSKSLYLRTSGNANLVKVWSCR